MIVSGRVAQKMAPIIKRLYDQMADPKWVISMGACASSGGVFDNYAIVQGVDTIVPVDVYVPGCPPTPDGLLYAVNLIQQQIRQGGRGGILAPSRTPCRVRKLPRSPGTALDPTAVRPHIDDARDRAGQPAELRATLDALRGEGFAMLLDVGGVDYLAREPRFDVVYHLLALPPSARTASGRSARRGACACSCGVPDGRTVAADGRRLWPMRGLGRARGLRSVRHHVSTATRICGASRCRPTGKAIRCARTIRCADRRASARRGRRSR